MKRRALLTWVVAFLAASVAPARVAAQANVQRFLYAGVPGVGADQELGGVGVLIFDIDRDHAFVGRISLDAATGGAVEPVRGIAAHAGTGRLYVATTRRMIALDLSTDQVVWQSDFDARCCDRMALSPDGSFMYVPLLGENWDVVDAADGSVIGTIEKERMAHNTIISDDGRFGYLASQGPVRTISVVDTRSHEIVRNIGPFGESTRPFTINGRQSLIFVNVDDLLGFEVGDIDTGKVLYRVEVPGFQPGRSPVHGIPSHGIAMTADETEIWVSDNANYYAHVFDATVMPPVLKTSVKLRGEPGWITFGIDGRFAYPSTGDVVDVRSKQIVATLEDEDGRDVYSEKIVEVDFENGRPVRASDQFGKGAVR
jgi:DNA-binding beta-propeller fold protein YncE